MRRFSAEYLADTRRGMWAAEDRAALTDLSLADRERVLDVGCGTGAFTRVLAEEAAPTTEVLGVDRDPALLAALEDGLGAIRGDAIALPIRSGGVDLAACQALLVNLPDPEAAIAEFARVSSALVAAIEPDNSAVTVESSVDEEVELAARTRERYVSGVDTAVDLGAVPDRFRAAGLVDVRTRRYDHELRVEPPYTDRDVESARRKASGAGLDDRRAALLAGGLTAAAFDRLRADWRAMGRTVARQMADQRYRRREVIPFHVTVGRVPEPTAASTPIDADRS